MQKSCKQCRQPFEITYHEKKLRETVSPTINNCKYKLPLPTLCPDCRYQRRIANRNEWTLYNRKCDKSGASIISIYSQDKQFPVYSQPVWWGDEWDPLDYGRDFDVNRPFFEQFTDLQKMVPRLAITNSQSENCDYTNQAQRNKDCYLIVASNDSEGCFYGNWYQNCRDCIDCYAVSYSDFCYECINGLNLYRCLYTIHSENCNEVYFSSDCKGCSYLFGCHGLRNKSYLIFNKQITKEEWEAKIERLELTPDIISKMKKKSYEILLKTSQKYYQGKSNEDFSGDWLHNCKQVYNSFNCRDAWDMEHSQDTWDVKNCIDMTETLTNEVCGELEGCGIVHFSFVNSKSWDNSNIYYSDLCFNSSHLFGCVGLKHKKYCILNKQYSKNDYFRLVPQIIEHMRKTNEWGEFFPVSNSPFAYNETVAQEYFPLTKEEVLNNNWQWKDDLSDTTNKATSSWTEIPERISDVKDTIKEKILLCQECSRNYRIIASELSFYRKIGVPIPRKCFACRRNNRYQIRNPRKLWQRECDNCHTELQSTFEPKRAEKIFCEKCYLTTVN